MFKRNLINFFFIFIIFLIDRISKIYILKLAEQTNYLNLYLTPYLNLNLIWNNGIAFGLLSFEDNFIYNIVSLIIFFIIIIIIIMLIKAEKLQRISLILVLGGALGNLFDRIENNAVPDFIDFHLKSFHWFIFNVADIFITIGILCLIYAELFIKKIDNEKII